MVLLRHQKFSPKNALIHPVFLLQDLGENISKLVKDVEFVMQHQRKGTKRRKNHASRQHLQLEG